MYNWVWGISTTSNNHKKPTGVSFRKVVVELHLENGCLLEILKKIQKNVKKNRHGQNKGKIKKVRTWKGPS